ncbi:MAG: PLP-dependent lyase/thiolase [Candidatus Andersenbacteria bacterium]
MKKIPPVGQTPLLSLRDLQAQLGMKAVFVKNESKNPFGTVKDRRNLYVFQEASRLKVDKLVLITSGNNGYSLAQFAKNSPIKVVCIVSRDLSIETKNILRQAAYQVIELNLNHKIMRPEELVAFAREKEEEVIWEVTNGYEENYHPIVKEIFAEVEPSHIVVPVGSGGIYLGIIQALENKKKRTQVIGIGVQNTTQSFGDKLSTPWTPYSKALEFYQKAGHPIYRLSEQEIKKTYAKFQNVVDCEPSSAAVFAAPDKHKFNSNDTVVFLNSGKTLID